MPKKSILSAATLRKLKQKGAEIKGVNAALFRAEQSQDGWIQIPLPPSTNNLFINLKRGGRTESPKYRAWKKEVAPILESVSPVRTYPVQITLAIRDGKGWRSNSDIANREKAATDALVSAGIITDDQQKYVRRLVMEFWDSETRNNQVVSMFIRIEPMQPIKERV
jgi:Holliday junction resolvase RusA-like endonuclease